VLIRRAMRDPVVMAVDIPITFVHEFHLHSKGVFILVQKNRTDGFGVRYCRGHG
jgi:hypothetical protein